MYFSTHVLKDLFEYGAAQRLDLDPLLQRFGHLSKEKYVSYDTIVQSLNYLGKALDDQYLGLHIGEQISLKATEYVDSIMLNSQTLEAAIINGIEYSKVISNALECSLEKTDRHFSVIYEENPNWGVHQQYAKRQIIDLTLLCNVKSVIAYTNHDYYPVKVYFKHERPKKLKEYYRLYNCSLEFNKARTEIVYERQIMDKYSSKQINQGLLENLKEKVATEIESLPVENELVHQLKKRILGSKPERILLNEAASGLHLSGRSLQRKLKNFGTNFKEVEHELQLKLAKTYLEERQKSIDEISYLLGFSESSAFIRFFKGLTTKTPSEYQYSTVS